MIYLDNAATTLKKPPCVAEAVVRAMATMGNSGRSAHQEALDASRVIYRTREQLARLLGCSAAEAEFRRSSQANIRVSAI